ncbi:MAG: phosphatidylglycerophosphatase A [Planctomycetota bacterium]
MTLPIPRRLALVTVFGLGHMRPFPGTWGSLPPVFIAGGLFAIGVGPATAPIQFIAAMVALVVVFSAACVVLGDRAEARFGKKDPSAVVADETAGQALALAFLPAIAQANLAASIALLLWMFVAFRLLDIAKPWPISAIQRVPGGWGILLDDLLAGLVVGIITIVLALTLL